MVINIGAQNSLVMQYMRELRDVEMQNDRMRFRRNLERLGEIFAYEISKKLDYRKREITTPLGQIEAQTLKADPVLATILRAGIPLHQGLLNFFDHSENAFISAYREHNKNDAFSVKVEYVSCPDLKNRILILTDPMLATGFSMELAFKALLDYGTPAHTHIVTVVASAQGIEYISKVFSKTKSTLWVAAIDEELTAQGYIVPGLGDAGDLAFGLKS